MALERRKTSGYWYARFTVVGRRVCVRLETKVQGSPGSQKFMESELAAREEEGRLRGLATKGDADFHRKMAEALGPDPEGLPKRSVPMADLGERWGRTLGRGALSPRWRGLCLARLGRFTAWAVRNGVYTLNQAGRRTGQAYLAKLKGDGLSAATVNSTVALLRRVFRVLGPAAGVKVNPFEGLPRMAGRGVNRLPLGPEELGRLLGECPREIAGAVATAACTGLRRGDACRLEWRQVDLKGGMLRGIRVAKTGAVVDVPILPMLRKYLEAEEGFTTESQRTQMGEGENNGGEQPRGKGSKEQTTKDTNDTKRGRYVWPEAARLERENPNGLNWRMNKALQAARLAGTAERRGAGVRAANVRGWHSLKTTFVTEALNNGMPMELLRKVVGNSAVEVVREHYYQPDRKRIEEELRRAMGAFVK